MEITVDMENANGTGFKIGPFKVLRCDWGRDIADGGQVVWTESVAVTVGEKTYKRWIQVHEKAEHILVPGALARERWKAFLEALEELRVEVEMHFAGGLQL